MKCQIEQSTSRQVEGRSLFPAKLLPSNSKQQHRAPKFSSGVSSTFYVVSNMDMDMDMEGEVSNN